MLRHAHDRPAHRRPGRLRASLASGALLAASIVPLTLAATGGTAHAAMNNGDVIANLFMWNWRSVAKECTTVLGPGGYGGVQVAPPEDSFSTSGHPWWEIYQPVDYNLTSRMGDEAEFKSMVAACRGAGVKVYVDAVINHTTGSSGTSYGGVSFSKYSYPDYANGDFHHYPADCPQPDGQVHNWNDYTEVTHCELLNLADLRTESEHVRDTLAAYLNKLISYGVSGFRVDAAKHVGHDDMAAIEAKLNTTADGTKPYMAQEIVPGGSGDLAPASFENTGNVLGFDYADGLKSAFTGNMASLKDFGSGLLGGGNEEVFVQNHDTERDGTTLSYKNGAANTLATEFELAYGYGTPQVYAGFDFANRDDSPPADGSGHVTDTTCGSGWECTDRIPGVAAMVGWHNTVSGTPVADWYDDGSNLIAFSRGAKGWIAINNEDAAQTKTFATGLPAGSYCDVIHGSATGGNCSGPSVTVDSSGNATVQVPAHDAVAVDVAALGTGVTVSASFDATVTTWYGQNVYVVGSLPALGGWNPAGAVALSPAAYPVWKATVNLPAGTSFEYKYIKKDPDGTVEWESGANRTASTGTSAAAAFNDTWK